jgi:hypothetical protein
MSNRPHFFAYTNVYVFFDLLFHCFKLLLFKACWLAVSKRFVCSTIVEQSRLWLSTNTLSASKLFNCCLSCVRHIKCSSYVVLLHIFVYNFDTPRDVPPNFLLLLNMIHYMLFYHTRLIFAEVGVLLMSSANR